MQRVRPGLGLALYVFCLYTTTKYSKGRLANLFHLTVPASHALTNAADQP